MTQRNHISIQERLFKIFETLQVKSPCFETAAGTHKTETFPIPRDVYVKLSRKESIFDVLSHANEDIGDDLPVDDEYNIEEEESEVTVMEIDNLRNECMRETEEDINRRLLINHEVVNKGCYRKKQDSCVGLFPSI